MRSFFARLPTELQAKVLQTIINTGAGSLIPFLRAFPELAHLVLLISDHTRSPFKLVDIPGIEAVDLGDHHLIARLRPAKPITVLSFKNCDEEAGIGRLTRSSHCAYGKYIDSKSAVFVEIRGKALLGNSFIRELAESKGCVLGTTLIVQHLRELVSPNHIEIDCSKKRYIKSIVPIQLAPIFDDDEVPWLLALPHPFFLRYYFMTWATITKLTIYNHMSFPAIVHLPDLDTMRFLVDQRKCRDTTLTVPYFMQGYKCDLFVFEMQYAYRVKKVYLEFVSAKTPYIGCGPYTCSKISEADQFSFINMDWSENDPSLSSALCEHAIVHGRDYLEWSETMIQRDCPLTFLKIFKEIAFVGIPDSVLLLSTFTNARHLTWKRLVPEKPAPSAEDQSVISCPKLETLHLATLLRRKDDKDHMPKIDAPGLQSMELCAVYGSTTAWNLPFHFSEETLASVQDVCMVFKQRECTPGLAILLADLEPLSQSLQSLILGGCLPVFLLDSEDTVESTAVFAKLTSLRVDMEYLPLETIKGKPRPIVSLLLDRDAFPVLEDLTLTLEFPDRSPLLSAGVCDVNIQVTSSCQVLTVAHQLVDNHFFMVKEDEEWCQVVKITREQFFPAVGEPGFVSASVVV